MNAFKIKNLKYNKDRNTFNNNASFSRYNKVKLLSSCGVIDAR